MVKLFISSSKLVLTLQGVNFQAFQTIFLIIIGLYLISFFFSYHSKLKKDLCNNNHIETNPLQMLKEFVNEKKLWKLVIIEILCSLILGAYFQIGFVFPIFMDRDLGDNSYYEIIIPIHSLLIIILSPILTILLNYFSIYSCLIIGGIIIGIAPGFFSFGSNYYTISVYVLFNAVGGSIFESRLYDYCGFASVPGKEGIFFTTLGIPYSLSFVVTGLLGGKFLELYCSDDGERNCWAMWELIGLVSLTGSAILFIFKRFLEEGHKLTNLE